MNSPNQARGTLLVLVGPTCSGKTAIASAIAPELNAEIVCADSRQIYTGMDIGSAQPSEDEFSRTPHHLFRVRNPDEPASAGWYRDAATRVVDEILDRRRVPLVVGGTGLYIRALLGSWSLIPSAKASTMSRLRERAEREGKEALWEELKGIDPDSAQRLHPNDLYRVMRALSIPEDTGRTASQWRDDERPLRRRACQVCLEVERGELYARIDERCREMMKAGMMREAESLLGRGMDRVTPVAKSIGYAHLFAALEGKITTEEALKLLQRDTRRFAKRQLTWLRHQQDLHMVDTRDRAACEKDAIRVFREGLRSGVSASC